MNRVQTAAGALNQVSVNAQMLEQDRRLHSGDTLWYKGELQQQLSMMNGVVGRANQENSKLKRYCHHLGAMLAKALGHRADGTPLPCRLPFYAMSTS